MQRSDASDSEDEAGIIEVLLRPQLVISYGYACTNNGAFDQIYNAGIWTH